MKPELAGKAKPKMQSDVEMNNLLCLQYYLLQKRIGKADFLVSWKEPIWSQ